MLLLWDESLGKLNKSQAKAVGLVSHGEKEWLRTIVSDECRKTLRAPLEGCSVVLENYAARLAFKPNRLDGLVAGIDRKIETEENQDQLRLNWGNWPKVYGSSNFDGSSRRAKSVYIELDKFAFYEQLQENKRPKLGPHWDSLTITAVSPVIVPKSSSPFFYASFVRPTSTVAGVHENDGSKLIRFQGESAVQWLPLLQPGDAISVRRADFDPELRMYVVNDGTSVVRAIIPHSLITGASVQVYEGCISRRIGSFVFEMDGVPHMKLWCSHVPAFGAGRGLCPGAKVKIFNPSELWINGRFEGLVLSFRSSFQIVHFSSHPNATCIQFSHTLQKLLGPVTARAAYWLLTGLVILGNVMDFKCSLKALLNEFKLDKANKGALDDFEKYRGIQSEFIDADTKWLLPSDEKHELPELIPVCHLDYATRRKLASTGLPRPLKIDPKLSLLHTHGTSAWNTQFSCLDLFPNLVRVQLVGLAVMTPKGQLCLRDSSGSIALSDAEEDLRSMLLKTPAAGNPPRAIAFKLCHFGRSSSFERTPRKNRP